MLNACCISMLILSILVFLETTNNVYIILAKVF